MRKEKVRWWKERNRSDVVQREIGSKDINPKKEDDKLKNWSICIKDRPMLTCALKGTC
jgi:hypothetical protein